MRALPTCSVRTANSGHKITQKCVEYCRIPIRRRCSCCAVRSNQLRHYCAWVWKPWGKTNLQMCNASTEHSERKHREGCGQKQSESQLLSRRFMIHQKKKGEAFSYEVAPKVGKCFIVRVKGATIICPSQERHNIHFNRSCSPCPANEISNRNVSDFRFTEVEILLACCREKELSLIHI